MKTSLKNLLLISFLAIYSLAFSQSDKQGTSVQPAAETGKVRFGIQFGMNVSNIKTKIAYEDTDVSPRVSANIGTLLDIHIKKPFTIQTGMLLTSKGANYETIVAIRRYYSGDIDIHYENENIRTMLIYLEIPANLLYNLQVGRGNFFFGTGLYFSCGIYGKGGVDSRYNKYFHSDDNFKGAYKMYNRFDMGLNLLGGYEFDCGLYLKTGYAIGLKNISDSGSDRDKINEKNRCFDISIGCKIK